MEYIVHRRFKGKCISGTVNLPYGKKCTVNGNIITADGKPIAATTSENAYQYFARNDDGQGLKRGELTHEIMQTLKKWRDDSDDRYDKAWERIWNDAALRKFKRTEYADYWVWNFNFYNAEISDLEYILNLIKEQ